MIRESTGSLSTEACTELECRACRRTTLSPASSGDSSAATTHRHQINLHQINRHQKNRRQRPIRRRTQANASGPGEFRPSRHRHPWIRRTDRPGRRPAPDGFRVRGLRLRPTALLATEFHFLGTGNLPVHDGISRCLGGVSDRLLGDHRSDRRVPRDGAAGDHVRASPRALAVGFIRAVLCVLFAFGLLWSAVDRRRRSLQDIVLRTEVVYDWRQDPDLVAPHGGEHA